MIEKAISLQEALEASPRFEVVADVQPMQTLYSIKFADEDSTELLFTIEEALAVIEAKLEQGFAIRRHSS